MYVVTNLVNILSTWRFKIVLTSHGNEVLPCHTLDICHYLDPCWQHPACWRSPARDCPAGVAPDQSQWRSGTDTSDNWEEDGCRSSWDGFWPEDEEICLKLLNDANYLLNVPCVSTACGFWAVLNLWCIHHRFHRSPGSLSPGPGLAAPASLPQCCSASPCWVLVMSSSSPLRDCFCQAEVWWIYWVIQPC